MPRKHATILIVDDEVVQRRLLREQLGEMDLELRIVEADDAVAALEAARRERPDLVLLDWVMPRGSGVQVCRAITDDPQLSAVRVVMLTGLNDPRDAHTARQAGASGYLVKPASPEELCTVVLKVLEGSTRFVRQAPTPRRP